MKRKGVSDKSQAEISRRKFLGIAAGGTVLSLFNSSPVLAGRSVGYAQYPVLTDYVGRLCFNENPLGPSPEAITAINNNANMGHRYPDWYAESLRQDLADLHDVQTGQTIAGCGATEIIRLCALAFVDDDCNVVSPYPSYSQFPSDAGFLGASVRYSYLDGNYRVDLDNMASLVNDQTNAVILTNPNNPTATVLGATDIADFVDDLPNHVVTLIDEAYHEYVEDSSYQSAIDLVRQGKKVIVIRTFSKVFGLAGMRIGYAIGRSDLIQQMNSWHIFASVSRLSLAAARAALDDQSHISNTLALNCSAKQYCFNYFDLNSLSYIPSETNFFMLETQLPAGQLAGELAQRGISVRTGWGMPNHIRVSTGTMAEMESFITALDEILDLVRVDGHRPLPSVTSLDGNYPNPFNSSTRISYSVAIGGQTLIQIFDVHGRLVKTVVNGYKNPGNYSFSWNGDNQAGKPVASGSYFIRMTTHDFAQTRRMILIK